MRRRGLHCTCRRALPRRARPPHARPAPAPTACPPQVFGRRTPLKIQAARVGGVEIPNQKYVEFSLQYIFGIGHTTAKAILVSTGVENKRTKVGGCRGTGAAQQGAAGGREQTERR